MTNDAVPVVSDVFFSQWGERWMAYCQKMDLTGVGETKDDAIADLYAQIDALTPMQMVERSRP